MTTFHIDADGKIIRATSDPKAVVEGSVTKTDIPPNSGRDTWNGTGWDAAPARVAPLTAEELYDILEAKGHIAETDRPRPKAQ